MKITFPSFSIILSLIAIFMIAGLYSWIFFGTIRFDIENAKQLNATQQLLNNNKIILQAIYSDVTSLYSQKNLNLTIYNHAILSDTNHIVHKLLNLTMSNKTK